MKIPAKPPDIAAMQTRVADILKDSATLRAWYGIDGGLAKEPYTHWDKVRFLPPPAPFTVADVWAATKFKRFQASRRLEPFNMLGRTPTYCHIADFQRALHEIDSHARGTIAMPGGVATAEGRDVYLQKSLMEEPYSSSVLEGAATTREAAVKMIEEGRAPKTVDERMVLNNYHAMNFIRAHRDAPLTPARILELHGLLTAGTLKRPEKVGVLRGAEDDVRVVDQITGETFHMPPPAAELPERLAALCAFANEDSDRRDAFLHPVIRAIILHFMLAYDHPFWDGNGRCARALFYWCVSRHGYWLLEYISISSVIRRAPVKYGMAFLHSETDDADLTYFIQHQLDVVEVALDDLRKYLTVKSQELNDLAKTMGALEGTLNRRQLALVQQALKYPGARYTIAEQADLHNVSYLTARSDLENLAKRGLLQKTKDGVKIVFNVPDDLRGRLSRRPVR